MKKSNIMLMAVLFLAFTTLIFSQTPMYYNFNNGTSSNSFPFNVAGGKAVNSLFLAGEFAQPTPCPAGQKITKVYFRTSTTGSRTYTNLHILMAQSTITTLTTGSFYSGPWDTVYFNASASLNSTSGGWMEVTLNTPYNYDITKSLVLFVGHCGATGSAGSVYNSTASDIRRTWSVGGCPFAPYTGGDGSIVNFGIDVVPAAPPTCSKYASSWCPLNTYPTMPAATYFNCAAWLGDTLYVQTPSTTGAGATTINRYTWNGSWSTGVPCLVAVSGASLTACNGKLYLIGGGSSVTVGSTNCQIYNPATGTWTAGAPMPASLSAHGAANWGDSVIFIVGGPYSGAGTNLAVHYYRVGSNTWGTISNSLPSGQGRRTFAMGITNGNKIVITAGYNTAYLNSTYVGTIGANATQIVWTAGANAPQLLSRPAGVGYGNTMFLSGGDTNGTAGKNPNVYCYNVSANSWFFTIPSNPNPTSNAMNALTARCINDTLRLVQPGGYTGAAGSNVCVITGCGGTFVGVENISSIPRKYRLSQNYPNPFNPNTIIEFSIPDAGNIKITVFDILGREVDVIVNGFLKAGSYTVDFNGRNLASGVYMYMLTADGFTDTKKMLLVK